MDGLLRPATRCADDHRRDHLAAADVPGGGQPTLAISGLNLLHRFRTQQESPGLREQDRHRDRQRDRRRLQRRPCAPTQPPSAARSSYEYLFQDNEYDIIFLLERARRIGYDLFVEEGDEPAPAARTSARRPASRGPPTSSTTAGR